MILRGFDISDYQGPQDWGALKSRWRIDWSAVKACEGLHSGQSSFKTNWSRMANEGLRRVAYYFAHPNQDPAAAAAFFVNTVKSAGPMKANDLMCLDLEVSDGQSQVQVNAYTKAWATNVRRLLPGYIPILYAGSGYMGNGSGTGLKGLYGAWWYPRYPAAWSGRGEWPSTMQVGYPADDWGGAPDVWQFSDNFPAGGGFDANVFFGDASRWDSLNGGDDMALTDADVAKVWAYLLEDPDSTVTPKVKNAAGTILRYLVHNEGNHIAEVDGRVAALKQQLTDLGMKVDHISAGDPSAIAAGLAANQDFVTRLAVALGKDFAARMQQ